MPLQATKFKGMAFCLEPSEQVHGWTNLLGKICPLGGFAEWGRGGAACEAAPAEIIGITKSEAKQSVLLASQAKLAAAGSTVVAGAGGCTAAGSSTTIQQQLAVLVLFFFSLLLPLLSLHLPLTSLPGHFSPTS